MVSEEEPKNGLGIETRQQQQKYQRRSTLHSLANPASQNAQNFHNVPVSGTVMVPIQMVRGAQAPVNNQQGDQNVPNGQNSVGMGSSYRNFWG